MTAFDFIANHEWFVAIMAIIIGQGLYMCCAALRGSKCKCDDRNLTDHHRRYQEQLKSERDPIP